MVHPKKWGNIEYRTSGERGSLPKRKISTGTITSPAYWTKVDIDKASQGPAATAAADIVFVKKKFQDLILLTESVMQDVEILIRSIQWCSGPLPSKLDEKTNICVSALKDIRDLCNQEKAGTGTITSPAYWTLVDIGKASQGPAATASADATFVKKKFQDLVPLNESVTQDVEILVRNIQLYSGPLPSKLNEKTNICVSALKDIRDLCSQEEPEEELIEGSGMSKNQEGSQHDKKDDTLYHEKDSEETRDDRQQHKSSLLDDDFGLDENTKVKRQLLQQSASSEDFLAKEKFLQLQENIQETLAEFRNKTAVLESMQHQLILIQKDLKEGHLQMLNDAIFQWNEIHGKSIEQLEILQQPNTDTKPEWPSQDHHLDSLDANYNSLLKDLESFDDDDDLIEGVYMNYKANRIVIEVSHGKYNDAKDMIKLLPADSPYQGALEIAESDPVEHLMHQQVPPSDEHNRQPLLIGNGSYIEVINNSDEYLDELLNDASVKSVGNIDLTYETEDTGTLTCITKHQEDFYAMTAHHVLDHHNSSRNNKHVISEVHYKSPELHLADIIHLSSSHFGKLGIVNTQNENRAVDVALMRINQRWLDRGLLKQIPVFTRDHFKAFCPNAKNLIGMKVKKFGAITKETTGEIIDDSYSAKICPQNMGKVVAVCGLNSKPFAEPGDSGALVTLDIEHAGGAIEEHALGIVSSRKSFVHGYTNVILCVRLEDCLRALESVEETLDHSAIELYRGFLKPAISVTDRREPHQTESV